MENKADRCPLSYGETLPARGLHLRDVRFPMGESSPSAAGHAQNEQILSNTKDTLRNHSTEAKPWLEISCSWWKPSGKAAEGKRLGFRGPWDPPGTQRQSGQDSTAQNTTKVQGTRRREEERLARMTGPWEQQQSGGWTARRTGI